MNINVLTQDISAAAGLEPEPCDPNSGDISTRPWYLYIMSDTIKANWYRGIVTLHECYIYDFAISFTYMCRIILRDKFWMFLRRQESLNFLYFHQIS